MSSSLLEIGVDDAPLDKRAWVLQERLLTPRQINCWRFQLSWECHESVACEVFPFIYEPKIELKNKHPFGGLNKLQSIARTLLEVEYLRSSKAKPDVFPGCRNCNHDVNQHKDTKYGFRAKKIIEQLKTATRNEWIAHAILHLYQEWALVIEEYSCRALSHRSDKLVAIDGIASRMRDALQGMDEYVAGLWRSQLHWQLIWRPWRKLSADGLVDTTVVTSRRYDIGPSWSWASTNTPVL
ncbi:hypothetical protein F4806DRAFT_80324 [Annulohypoxylon nitens]|nr:hypothetical protein F4806DRAFT_80324 [Annulohypoxylon nitens]